MNELDIFSKALELADPEARGRYLHQTCGADSALRQRIEALLRNAEETSRFLETPAIVAALGTEAATGDPEPSAGAEARPDAGSPNLDFLSPADDPAALGCLGPYVVTEVVGSGGMGIVLKACDESLHRVVALKVLAPELSTNPTARKRFLREGKSAAAVVHQHVVTIHAVAEDRLPYIVMEFVHGPSLQAKIDAEGHLNLNETLRIGAQIAAGLAAAHAQGVIHRDIKPSNILLENGIERVRISDFGLARAVDDVEITRPGEVAGTPQYMSPEQAQGQPVDARSDLFSFGCVLYAMCTGRPPFRAETTIEAIRRVCDEAPRPIREINPDVPEWLAEIVDRLLAKLPGDRFQTAQEVSEILARSLAHVQDPVASPPPAMQALAMSPIAAKASPTSRRWLAAAVILVGILSILAATDATGVTQLSETVIRIVTGEGTLVIETDDPSIEVSLDGEELTIRGGGVQQVKLRPGQYQFVATKNGRPVKRELVTVTRGGRRVVTVTREADSAPTATAALKSQPGAFVILSGAGAEVGKFDTLAEAVLGASDGVTIEIRGNGPYLCPSIRVAQTVSIRAGEGFRPTLQEPPGTAAPLLTSTANLVLEGIEFLRLQDLGAPTERVVWSIVQSSGGSLHVANCRFLQRVRGPGPSVTCFQNRRAEFRNCEFLRAGREGGQGISVDCPPEGELVLENCLDAGWYNGLELVMNRTDVENVAVRLRSCTCAAPASIMVLPVDIPPSFYNLEAPQPARVSIEAAHCVFDFRTALLQFKPIGQSGNAPLPQPWVDVVRRVVAWRDEQSLYFGNVFLSAGPGQHAPASLVGIEAWNRYWGQSLPNSIDGEPRYHGGDVYVIPSDADQRLSSESFRLREGSAGYQAGPDGKDLGADVDLLGPGEAYERWKETPEYQQWLNDTSQRLDSAAAQSPREEDLDREAAIWVLSLGGTVKVFPCDDDVKIAEVKDLPAPPFQLQYVMLGDNPRVNDAGLARLKGLGRLDTLHLFKTPVTDAGLVHLRDLKTLKVLYLSYTQVGDDGLLHLRELENLTLLSLYGTKVSDAGLAHLTSLKKLTQLNLSGTQVSDLGLPTLYALANLREVGLRDTLATAGGVAALQKALPSCRIIWSDSDTELR